jgi:putative ABC transport system permease protein
MTPFRVFLHRLRGLFFKQRVDRDLDDELRFHVEMQVEENLRAGMAPEKAHQAALREFGGLAQIKESYRDGRTLQTVETMIQDIRYGLRTLWKTPGWTAVIGATLALGVGLSTAIFSLTYNVLLRALPYPDPQQLAAIRLCRSTTAYGFVRYQANALNWTAWRGETRLFEDIALSRAKNFNLTGDGRPDRVVGAQASWNLFQVLGVQPILGRMFTEDETRRDAKLTMLSYGFWEKRYALDPNVLGQKILLDGESHEILGVAPPGFQYPSRDIDVWTPLFIRPEEQQSTTHFFYDAVGRLKSNVPYAQAQVELSSISQRLPQFTTRSGTGPAGACVESLTDNAVGAFRTSIYTLIAAVGCLLLLGCINLSGLLIVRAAGRRREFAVRAALGASRARLQGQILAEILPLSALSAGGGALLAWGMLKIMTPFLPPHLPGIESIGLHGPALGVTISLSVIVVMIAGILPARMTSRIELTEVIKGNRRSTSGVMRNTLVAAQIALTLALVFAGGLLARSLAALWKVGIGFSPQNVLTMQLEAVEGKYPTPVELGDYYRRLTARVKTTPGVIEAAVINRLPFINCCISGGAEFESKRGEGQFPSSFLSITPGFFRAMGIPLLRGRDFSETDLENAQPVGVLDEQLARKVFGDEDPIGKRFRFGVITDRSPWLEIIGVVGHIHQSGLESDRGLQVYWPIAQHRAEIQFSSHQSALVLRTTGKPETYASAVVSQIQKENPDQPVYDIRSMEDRIARSLQSRNLLTGLVSVFAGSALLLASLGLYGVVSYGARLRLREFAIRSALGALPGDLRRLVLSHAASLWIIGSTIGLAATWPIGQAMKSQLFGVGSADGVSLAVAPTLLLVIALLAALGPALKAGKVDPAAILRCD